MPFVSTGCQTEVCPDMSSFIAFQLYGCGQILEATGGGGGGWVKLNL